MYRSLLNLKLKQKASSSEEGMTVVETMVAFVIIAIVLVSTAYTLTVAFKTSATNENRAKASAIASDVIAVAKQADFQRLYVAIQSPTPATLFGPGKCSTNQTSLPSANMVRVTTGSDVPFEGLVYCQARQQGNASGGVGTTFFIETRVVFLTAGQGSASTRFFPKRVYVTVKWQDVASGEGKWNTYTTSYTSTPSPSECVPDTVVIISGTLPLGCRP